MHFIKQLLTKSFFYKLAGLLVIDVLFFSATNARTVASIFLVAGLILLIATIYYLIYGLLSLARFYELKIYNQKRLAGSLTGVCGALLPLQSLGELSLRDVLVILPIGLIAYLYVSYGANKRDQLL